MFFLWLNAIRVLYRSVDATYIMPWLTAKAEHKSVRPLQICSPANSDLAECVNMHSYIRIERPAWVDYQLQLTGSLTISVME